MITLADSSSNIPGLLRDALSSVKLRQNRIRDLTPASPQQTPSPFCTVARYFTPQTSFQNSKNLLPSMISSRSPASRTPFLRLDSSSPSIRYLTVPMRSLNQPSQSQQIVCGVSGVSGKVTHLSAESSGSANTSFSHVTQPLRHQQQSSTVGPSSQQQLVSHQHSAASLASSPSCRHQSSENPGTPTGSPINPDNCQQQPENPPKCPSQQHSAHPRCSPHSAALHSSHGLRCSAMLQLSHQIPSSEPCMAESQPAESPPPPPPLAFAGLAPTAGTPTKARKPPPPPPGAPPPPIGFQVSSALAVPFHIQQGSTSSIKLMRCNTAPAPPPPQGRMPPPVCNYQRKETLVSVTQPSTNKTQQRAQPAQQPATVFQSSTTHAVTAIQSDSPAQLSPSPELKTARLDAESSLHASPTRSSPCVKPQYSGNRAGGLLRTHEFEREEIAALPFHKDWPCSMNSTQENSGGSTRLGKTVCSLIIYSCSHLPLFHDSSFMNYCSKSYCMDFFVLKFVIAQGIS